mmetsp:Transcript_29415/g.59237  ORF Transcript_29415/g.59237 Transcript_29415/m.59237 type:complete len:120 (-) Transcript_29415:2416-2775(-)
MRLHTAPPILSFISVFVHPPSSIVQSLSDVNHVMHVHMISSFIDAHESHPSHCPSAAPHHTRALHDSPPTLSSPTLHAPSSVCKQSVNQRAFIEAWKRSNFLISAAVTDLRAFSKASSK